ncbi:MAG: hypothetical protein OEV41_09740 [Gammaproteobacteria bacterium]|nr:hypothetical protein [Gammaproteobacteria bacterium]
MLRNLVLFGLSLLAAGCGVPEEDPEAAIRAWVARGEAAAEEKDRSTLIDMISVDYADARGNDRDEIGDLLRLYFFRQQSIALLTSIDNISLSGETAALVTLTVGMAGTEGGALGLRADAYNFEFELEKANDDWLLIGARWSELGGRLH